MKQTSECPYCQVEVTLVDSIVQCPDCERLHHQKCWEANTQCCSMYGCSGTTMTRYIEITDDDLQESLPTSQELPRNQDHHRVSLSREVGVVECELCDGGTLYQKGKDGYSCWNCAGIMEPLDGIQVPQFPNVLKAICSVCIGKELAAVEQTKEVKCLHCMGETVCRIDKGFSCENGLVAAGMERNAIRDHVMMNPKEFSWAICSVCSGRGSVPI